MTADNTIVNAQQAFYAHKKDAHGGVYDKNCPTCRELWDRWAEASKRKAGAR